MQENDDLTTPATNKLGLDALYRRELSANASG
jgi:hypothetical protein